MPDAVEFIAELSETDWDTHLSGWRCSALAIPGAEVTLVVNGIAQDPDLVKSKPHLRVIRWLGNPDERPTRTRLMPQPLS